MARPSGDSRKTGSTELAQLIRVRRKQLGLSRQELADAAGIPYPTIAQIETAYRGVSPARLGVIARVLGLDPKDLYDLLASEPTSAGTSPAVDQGRQPVLSNWIANPSYSSSAEISPSVPAAQAPPPSGGAGSSAPTPREGGTPPSGSPINAAPTSGTPTRGWLPRARAIPAAPATLPTPAAARRSQPSVAADITSPTQPEPAAPTRDEPADVADAIARLLRQLPLAERVELLNDLQRQLMMELLQRQPLD